MPKIKVNGTVLINWECIVEADTLDEVEKSAIEMCHDGNISFDDFVDEPEVTNSVEIP